VISLGVAVDIKQPALFPADANMQHCCAHSRRLHYVTRLHQCMQDARGLYLSVWCRRSDHSPVPDVEAAIATPADSQVRGKSGVYITFAKTYCSCQAHYYEVVCKSEAPYVSCHWMLLPGGQSHVLAGSAAFCLPARVRIG
jgi:hypothetical protein